jgi:mono/diheme cytochrome c family protein
MRKKLILLLLASVIFSFFASISAGSAQARNLFLSKCGQCHKTGGSAPIFAPTKYAAKQWERFFARNKHQRKKDISDKVTQKELDIIEEYLIDHAADSSQPEAAGLK